MGLGIGDFDTDGHLDIFKTHFSADTHTLYKNNGKGAFRDVTTRAGLAVETRFVGWGAAIQDLDNDGLPDIFFTTGMVYPEVEPHEPESPFKTPSIVFRNLGGGKFEELLDQAGPAMKEVHSSRGAAFGDFDNDGDMDVLLMNINEPPSLLRNDLSGGGHWLKGAARRRGVQSQRHWGNCGRDIWGSEAGAGSLSAVFVSFGERSAAALRTGPGNGGRNSKSSGQMGAWRRSRMSWPINWWWCAKAPESSAETTSRRTDTAPRDQQITAFPKRHTKIPLQTAQAEMYITHNRAAKSQCVIRPSRH